MRSCHFENRYYSTDQMLSEYVHRVLCRKIVLFGAPIALVALIFAMLSWLDRDTVFFTLFGVCFLIVLLTALLSPTLMLRQMKEDDRRLHNGQKFETIVQFGDRILIPVPAEVRDTLISIKNVPPAVFTAGGSIFYVV